MSTLNVDKVDPNTGTALEIGSSGDTITVPSGATFAVSGTMNASSITAGTVATARLGTGTASSSTVLYGDQTYKTEPSGAISISGTPANNQLTIWTAADTVEGDSNFTYDGTDVTVTSGNLEFATSGKGIMFSGRSRSHELDDYEEGQFTSTIIGTGGTAGTYAYSGGVTRYTKIGRLIAIHGSGVCTNKGSYSGTAKISGLPFVGNDAPSSMSFGTFPVNSDISGGGYPKSFGITIGYQQDFMNCHCGNWWDSQIDWADIDTGRSFTFSGVYEDATGS